MRTLTFNDIMTYKRCTTFIHKIIKIVVKKLVYNKLQIYILRLKEKIETKCLKTVK